MIGVECAKFISRWSGLKTIRLSRGNFAYFTIFSDEQKITLAYFYDSEHLVKLLTCDVTSPTGVSHVRWRQLKPNLMPDEVSWSRTETYACRCG